MLKTPNVREQEPPHVRHRGHPRPLVLSVISPHESHELLHEIVVVAAAICSPDGENEVVLNPMLHPLPKNVFI